MKAPPANTSSEASFVCEVADLNVGLVEIFSGSPKVAKTQDEFKEKTGIVGLRWVAEKSIIELIGLKQQIDDTLMMLEGHSQSLT